MSRRGRSTDWGFPRWRGYGAEQAAATVRTCDRHGCDLPGTCPAPKAPNKPDRWMFCEPHAAEYNRNWDYFQGLSPEEVAAREAEEEREAREYGRAKFYGWGGEGDGTRSREEMRALHVLECEVDASFDDIKAAHRRLAKANHPDLNPGDEDAAKRFGQVQAAWNVLRAAEERRAALS